MDKEKIKTFIEQKISDRIRLLGLDNVKINAQTDLVREGYYDSLSFVDLIGECEEEFLVEVQLENYDPKDFSILHHLVEIIHQAKAR